VGYEVPTGQQSLRKTIYLYETTIPNNADPKDATCLVIGGHYNGSSQTTYYRIDFYNDDPAGVGSNGNGNTWEEGPPSSGIGEGGAVGSAPPFRPIIRNYHYEVQIGTVVGNGVDSKNTAAANRSSRMMTYEYITWDDQQMNVSIDNSTYYLTISKTRIMLSNSVLSEDITITTDYPEWALETPVNPWFKTEKINNKTLRVSLVGTPPSSSKTEYFKLLLKQGNNVKLEKKMQVVYYN
jgi:hypothetical protein